MDRSLFSAFVFIAMGFAGAKMFSQSPVEKLKHAPKSSLRAIASIEVPFDENQWLMGKKLIESPVASTSQSPSSSGNLARSFMLDKEMDIKLMNFRPNDLISLHPEEGSHLNALLNSKKTGVFLFQQQRFVRKFNSREMNRNLVFCQVGVSAGTPNKQKNFERSYISDLLKIEKVTRVKAPYPNYQGVHIKTKHVPKVYLGTYISYIDCFYPTRTASAGNYQSMEFLDLLFSLNARGYYHHR